MARQAADAAGRGADCRNPNRCRNPYRSIRVSLRLGHLDRVFVLGDETRLSRVVSNLVDNALK